MFGITLFHAGLFTLVAVICVSFLVISDRIEVRNSKFRASLIYASGLAAFLIPFLNRLES